MEVAAVTVFVLVGVFVLIPVLLIWKGFALSVLWGWFVAPLFGLPLLSIPSAIGICIVVGLIRYRYDASDHEKSFKPLGMQFASPAASLGVGWIIKTYFM